MWNKWKTIINQYKSTSFPYDYWQKIKVEYTNYFILLLHTFPRPWLITEFVTRVTRRYPLLEQELIILPKHVRLHSVFSGVRVARSLVFCVVFCRSLFNFFLWTLCCLSFDLRILITPLLSSNFSQSFLFYKHSMYLFRITEILLKVALNTITPFFRWNLIYEEYHYTTIEMPSIVAYYHNHA